MMPKRRTEPPELEQKPREFWRPVPGYGGKYQCSTEGRVRRILPDGRVKPVTAYENRKGPGRSCITVTLRDSDGKAHDYALLRVVALTWYPEKLQPGLQVIPRNGLHADCSAWNIKIVTPAERCRIQAAGRTRRAVRHIGPNGQLLELYPSMSAAARAAGISVSMVQWCCTGKRNRRRDGSTYRFDDPGGKKGRPRKIEENGDRRERIDT